MPGSLTTAVVDAYRGGPAAGMLIDLFRLPRGAGERHHLRTIETNGKGAIDGALIEGEAFLPATYELLYHVGRYFRSQRVTPGDAPFLEVIPVRFVIGDAGRSHHLALLVSPWSYTAFGG